MSKDYLVKLVVKDSENVMLENINLEWLVVQEYNK